MKKQNLYKIINQMLVEVMICAKDIEEAIEKYKELIKEKESYEKVINCIEYLGEVYFGE